MSQPTSSAEKSTDKNKEKEKKEDKENEKPKIDIGLLEDDDEFEEFPAEDWPENEEDEQELDVWEDNWDDDNVEDDFSIQLRAELQKQNKPLPEGKPTFS